MTVGAIKVTSHKGNGCDVTDEDISGDVTDVAHVDDVMGETIVDDVTNKVDNDVTHPYI